MSDRVTVGTLDELRQSGCLTGKAGAQPICVFWSEGAPFALDDRCPHMGFPLHRGTVESGLVTCHWHNARFDLSSGGTLDPWADDVRAYPVEIDDGQVTRGRRAGARPHRLPAAPAGGGAGAGHHARHRQGRARPARRRRGAERHRARGRRVRHPVPPGRVGRGAHRADRDGQRAPPPRPGRPGAGAGPRAGVRVARHPRPPAPVPAAAARRRAAGGTARRLVPTVRRDPVRPTPPSARWRRPSPPSIATAVADIMFAAVTDHVFLDGGHTIDFTNKAFEVLDHLGWEAAPDVLPTLVAQTASASRSEEQGSWRYPHDLAAMVGDGHRGAARTTARQVPRNDSVRPRRRGRQAGLVDPVRRPDRGRRPPSTTPSPPAPVPRSSAGPSPTPPRCGSPASTPRTTTATGTRCTTPSPPPTPSIRRSRRAPTPELLRGVYHGALRIYLDRFLNVPAARLPGPRADRRGGRPRRAAGLLGPGGTGRRGGHDRLPLPGRRRRSRAGDRRCSATRCSPRTPSSTGSRPTRPPSASSTPGRRAPRRAR